MDEQALRALVREAVAKHLQPPEHAREERRSFPLALDVSHYRYTLPQSEGPCLIEPAVSCNHCGYCESHGH